MTARISYMTTGTAVNINVDAVYPGPVTKHVHSRNQNVSGSGKTETINLYGAEEIAVECQFTPANYHSLYGWWSWARQGKHFSFALNSNNSAKTTLDSSATAGDTVIPLTATTGIDVGDVMLLRNATNDDEFEIITATSIKPSTSIKISSALIFSYPTSSLCRHKDYWPEALSVDESFMPSRTGIPSTNSDAYYRNTFSFRENL